MSFTPKTRGVLVALCLISLVSLEGCSWIRRFHFTSPFGRSDWVRLEGARVVEDPAPALTVNIVNRHDRRLWIRMEVDEVGGYNDCTNSMILERLGSHRYACPQATVEAGRKYRSEIRVFTDRGHTRSVERIRREIEILAGEDGELILQGRPAG